MGKLRRFLSFSLIAFLVLGGGSFAFSEVCGPMLSDFKHLLHRQAVLQFWRVKKSGLKNAYLRVGQLLHEGADEESADLRRAAVVAGFVDILDRIDSRLTLKEPLDLQSSIPTGIGRIDPQYAIFLGDLLLGLSLSQKGRELIDRMWPVLIGSGDHRLYLYFSDGGGKAVGRCSDIFKSEPEVYSGEIAIKVSPGITLGEAILVFAHELLHAYDRIVLRLDAGLSETDSTLLFERRAYRFEQLVLFQLLADSPSMKHFASGTDSLGKWLYNLNVAGFAKHLEAHYGVPESIGMTAPWGDVPLK